jgi:hypothetical protein
MGNGLASSNLQVEGSSTAPARDRRAHTESARAGRSGLGRRLRPHALGKDTPLGVIPIESLSKQHDALEFGAAQAILSFEGVGISYRLRRGEERIFVTFHLTQFGGSVYG